MVISLETTGYLELRVSAMPETQTAVPGSPVAMFRSGLSTAVSIRTTTLMQWNGAGSKVWQYNFVSGESSSDDKFGHGTHVASMACRRVLSSKMVLTSAQLAGGLTAGQHACPKE